MPDDAPHRPPGLRPRPPHVFYGGAHLFTPDAPRKLARLAQAALEAHAPDAPSFAEAFGIDQRERAARAREAVLQRLAHEPIADQRIDFEDGFGVRTDAEEDHAAERAGAMLAQGARDGTLATRVGVRVRAFDRHTGPRAARTLRGVLTAFVRAHDAPLPPGFVVTLPKVSSPAHAEALANTLASLERDLGLGEASIAMELLVETPIALAAPASVGTWIDAADGRVRSLHLGPYDLLSSLGVPADAADLHHPHCDAARTVILAHAALRGLDAVDGPTKTLPIGPGREGVHAGWRRHAHDIARSRSLGLHAGWDLHPHQLVSRHAANWLLADTSFDDAAARLRGFLEAAARASRVGSRFDDASSAHGLVMLIARALWSGARTEAAITEAVGVSCRRLLTEPFESLVQDGAPG